MEHTWYRLFLLACLVPMTSSFQCPPLCSCNPSKLEVHCTHNEHLPKDIPPSTLTLNINNNNITEITNEDFKGLFDLRTLSLKDNIIATIAPGAFSDLISLDSLDLTNNNLTHFDDDLLINQSSLTLLYLSDNKLNHIPNVRNCKLLKKLLLERNEIDSCFFPNYFHDFKSLKSVVLSNNNITNINVGDFQSLDSILLFTLDLSGCDIKHIDAGAFQWLSFLSTLKLSSLTTSNLRNALESLANNNRLKKLYLEVLDLDDMILPDDIFKSIENAKVDYLTMSRSKITALKDGTLKYLKNLQYLELEYCSIQQVDSTAFDGLTFLEEIRMAGNMLESVPDNLPTSLKYIDLSDNSIGEVTNNDLQNLQKLETLYLNINKIHLLHQNAFSDTDNLQVLDLSYNDIATIGNDVLSPLNKLVFLKLNNNKLAEIPTEALLFSKMENLEHLDLSHNGCGIMSLLIFSDLKNLTYLFLQENELGNMISRDVDGVLFSPLTKLQELHLEANGITVIPPLLFKNLVSLEDLYLYHNLIHHWANETFQGAPMLKNLGLSYNQISLINQIYIASVEAVDILNLTGNPFDCNCELLWFRQWITSPNCTLTLPNVHQYSCNSPHNLEGLLLTALDPDSFVCTDTDILARTYSDGDLISIIIGCILTLIAIVVSLCGYIYRWKIRLGILKRRLMRGHKIGIMDEQTVQLKESYDAYISYCPGDEDWVKAALLPMIDIKHQQQESETSLDKNGGYKLFYEKMDGFDNLSYTSNVYYAMMRSRKVLLVISEEYLKVSSSLSS